MTFEEELAKPENEYIAVIGRYLKDRALIDPAFAENLKKENKSLKRCYQYIIDEAEKMQQDNCAMIKSDIVFGWAVHYYDEDDLSIDKVDKVAKPTETKKQAKVKDGQEMKTENKKATKKKDVAEDQLSLF